VGRRLAQEMGAGGNAHPANPMSQQLRPE
jgi:hypothetical protein